MQNFDVFYGIVYRICDEFIRVKDFIEYVDKIIEKFIFNIVVPNY